MSAIASIQSDSYPGLVVSMSSDGPATVVELCGEADRATVALVVQGLDRVIAVQTGAVVVDLTQNAFLDISTIRAIGHAAQVLHDSGRSLMLRGPSRQATRILALAGLSCLIEPAAQASTETT